MRATFSILFLLLSIAGLAQVNLVPNGSFEEYSDCPVDSIGWGSLHLATGWYHPTISTADLFHECANPGWYGIPTAVGVYAAEGESMAQLGVWTNGGNSREYGATRLGTPLVAGAEYQFSINLHLITHNTSSIGSFGAFFSPDSATDYTINHTVYALDPQLQRDPDSIMSNPDIWYTWTDTLIAQGNEEFMVLGNFLPDSLTPFNTPPNGGPISGYFIDDISLVLIEDTLTTTQEMELPKLQLTTNVVQDELRFSASGPFTPTSISIYSLNGTLVYQRQLNGATSLDVSNLPAGMYVLSATSKEGAVARERFVKL